MVAQHLWPHLPESRTGHYVQQWGVVLNLLLCLGKAIEWVSWQVRPIRWGPNQSVLPAELSDQMGSPAQLCWWRELLDGSRKVVCQDLNDGCYTHPHLHLYVIPSGRAPQIPTVIPLRQHSSGLPRKHLPVLQKLDVHLGPFPTGETVDPGETPHVVLCQPGGETIWSKGNCSSYPPNEVCQLRAPGGHVSFTAKCWDFQWRPVYGWLLLGLLVRGTETGSDLCGHPNDISQFLYFCSEIVYHLLPWHSTHEGCGEPHIPYCLTHSSPSWALLLLTWWRCPKTHSYQPLN